MNLPLGRSAQFDVKNLPNSTKDPEALDARPLDSVLDSYQLTEKRRYVRN